MTFEGKTCVVTGSSKGIGRATAALFGADGANVVVNYYSSEAAAEKLVDQIEQAGGNAIAVQANVADMSDVDHMAERTHEAFGPVDVLVNNAGINIDCQFEEMAPEQWQRVIDVNLTGSFNCTDVFYEDIKSAEYGRLINIASIVGQEGNYGQANYAASKAGVIGFTKTLAIELAPHGTTANCVSPGFVDTEMVRNVPKKVLESILQRIPIDRLAQPAEVAAIVKFLASENSSYITGQVLPVNGGMYR